MLSSGFKLANVPFLRLLIPLGLGVSLPVVFTSANPSELLILLLLIWLPLLFFKNTSFRLQPFWTGLLLLFLIILGNIRILQTRTKFPVLQKGQYFVVIDEYPVEKEKTFQVVGQFINMEAKILAYLPKTPSVQNAKPGDIFFFNGFPELVQNDGNPFEFDYRQYLNNRGIGYRIFLKEKNYCILRESRQLNIYRIALIIRQKMIDKLRRLGIDKENLHLIASISFGDRDEVDKETIQSFTNTGVIHVLAVSGMNVGFVYIILDFILRFLKRFRAGKFLHAIITLLGIWSYTLITGMSASILRAAMMFTFVLIGSSIRRTAGIYNSLAVTAFLLIAWDPVIIEDVGFQLSYAAVLSIVVIQPEIYKKIQFTNKLLDKIWMMISVTLAAQIGTIPLTLHYFHQFPVYFLLANVVIIPLVTIILYLSFVVVFLSLIADSLAFLIAFFLNWSVWLVRWSVHFVDALPHSVLKGLYPSIPQLLLIFCIALILYYYSRTRIIRLLHMALILAIFLSVSVCLDSFYQQTRAEIIFFSISGTRALSITHGSEATVLYDCCENASEKLNHCMKSYFGERKIQKAEMFQLSDSLRIRKNDICVIGNFIFFNGFRLYIQPLAPENQERKGPLLTSDLVWLGKPVSELTKESDLPDSKIILCKLTGKNDGLLAVNKRRSIFIMNKSVQLSVPTFHPDEQARVVCDYFDKKEN